MKRHPLFRIILAIPILIAASAYFTSVVYGNYGKVDNLHIYYLGNRITGVLEDADPARTNGKYGLCQHYQKGDAYGV